MIGDGAKFSKFRSNNSRGKNHKDCETAYDSLGSSVLGYVGNTHLMLYW